MTTIKKNHKHSRPILAAATGITLSLGSTAFATDYTWDGGGGSFSTGWNAPLNWALNTTPSSSASTGVYFPMNAPGTSAVINAQGKLEFQFTVPDNAAFFRLQAQ